MNLIKHVFRRKYNKLQVTSQIFKQFTIKACYCSRDRLSTSSLMSSQKEIYNQLMGNSCCGLPSLFHKDQINQFPYQNKSKRKLSYQRPKDVNKGVTIRRNPQTGLYEGFPKEWADNNKIDINIDTSKTVTTSHLSDSIRPNPVIPLRILDTIQGMSEKPAIISQYNQKPSRLINIYHR